MTELTTLEELEACLAASQEKAIFIFKHSTACPVSAEALNRTTTFLSDAPEDCPDFYLVKVIESRPVSNEIAERLSIEHKSPQLILVKDTQGVWSSSHLFISAGAIEWAINNHISDAD